MCGEKISMEILVPYISGSPPHVRGKDAVKRHSARGFGITPAYAGKSRGCPAACILRRDHPRVCGEKALLCLSLQQILGSPPRMRGKAFPSIKTILLMRITPAYAGKSYLIGTGLSDTKDHPRVCGEKTVLDLSRLVEQGSPPRMRGKADPPSARFRVHGITPAYAGKRVL